MPKATRKTKAPAPRGWRPLFLAEGVPSLRIPFWGLMAPVLAFAVLQSFSQISSPDLWWHLKTGEWIWQQHSFPHTDPFSFTAEGQPWIAHEWLFGLLAFLASRAAGLSGILVLKSAIVGCLLALAAGTARARGASPGMTAMVLGRGFRDRAPAP